MSYHGLAYYCSEASHQPSCQLCVTRNTIHLPGSDSIEPRLLTAGPDISYTRSLLVEMTDKSSSSLMAKQTNCMLTMSQPLAKRARIHATHSRGQLNPNEEFSQVVDLVERRRLQNRISQRNYRERQYSRRSEAYG